MNDLRKAAEMALEALEMLWDILDDIDTASDMAKENDAWYRKRVEALQKKRWDTTITTDGYKLKGGPVEALRQALDDKPAVKSYAGGKPNYCTPEETLKTPLKVLNLTVFTENRLRNGRVYDVETLQAMTNRDILAIPDMGKKALKEVMEALDVYAVNMSQERVDETAKGEHEPLVWMNKYGHVASFQNEEYKDPLYTAPPKREWVGLDGEIPGLGLVTEEFYNGMLFAEDILREKNT